MTSCRARLGLACGLVALVAALPASAQAPEDLSGPGAPELPDARPAQVPDSRIEVQELKAPSPDSVGLLDERQGGFGPAMWEGTPAATVRRLLPALPADSGSHAVFELGRRLLLSSAAAPMAGGAVSGPSLVELRAERLLALGDVEGADGLLAATPGSTLGALGNRLKVEVALAGGGTAKACAQLPAAQAGGSDVALAKLQVLCHLTGGRTAEGNLALDLLRERKDAADPAFVAAAEAIAGLPPVPSEKLSLAQPGLVHVAAFAAAKQALPAAALDTHNPAVLRAIAAAEGLPPDQRLVAAEKAAVLGALDGEALRTLYAKVTFPAGDIAAALAKADSAGPRARALLFQAAAAAPDPVSRAPLLAKAMALGGEKAFAANARTFAPLLAELRPAPELVSFAPTAARALFAAGRPEAGGKWVDLAKADPQTARAAAYLWPLDRLWEGNEGRPLALNTYATWRSTLEGVPADQAGRRAALVLGLLSAVGARIPDGAWTDLMEAPALAVPVRPALWHMAANAGAEKRVGAAVLSSLALLPAGGLDKADPLTLAQAVSSLRAAGLVREARQLATDALVANGF